MRILAVCLAWLASLLPHHGHVLHGRGTIFGPPDRDRWHGSHHACTLGPRWRAADRDARALYAAGRFVAHPSLPCWARVQVCSEASGRCLVGVVADRGPRHALVDLWHVLARELRHDGGVVSLTTYPEGAPTP